MSKGKQLRDLMASDGMVLAPGAFFLIGLFIWALREWKTDQQEEY